MYIILLLSASESAITSGVEVVHVLYETLYKFNSSYSINHEFFNF